ncbi:MAG: hypothetical protein ACTS8S_04420 [Giesbergeria sp.]
MKNFAEKYANIQAKLAVFALLAMVLVGLLFWGEQQGSTTELVAAKVVALSAADDSAVALPLVWCELPDGTRVRLYAGNDALHVGDPVTLVQTKRSDGSRSYHLQAPAP